ncbi:YbaK/EbsC family protein [Vulcanisaeta distributa]|uniref:aminoacyl-tRNA deacylase n=1 Tax=Vulcanisaeta distributa TaxID=164451 RepID=UPI0006D1E632|nr:YbaK/EbsC family protein [Vulcanisaeta distributa]
MVKVRREVIMGLTVDVLEFDHGGVETVEAASRESGEPVGRIVKTLLLKAGDEYLVAIVRGGDKVINFDRLSKALGKSVAMAKAREVRQVLGVDVGAVTPLSERVLSLKVVMDPSILENDYVLCGGGSRNTLMRINVKDLVNLLKPMFIDAFDQAS